MVGYLNETVQSNEIEVMEGKGKGKGCTRSRKGEGEAGKLNDVFCRIRRIN